MNKDDMKKASSLLQEIEQAIVLHQSHKLTLNGLVSRIEEVGHELNEIGFEWAIPFDDCILNLEIINSIILANEAMVTSEKDNLDIDLYLGRISAEINRIKEQSSSE